MSKGGFGLYGWLRRGCALLLACLASNGLGQSYSDVHDFGGSVVNIHGLSVSDGRTPSLGVTFDSSGNEFGATTQGGELGKGIVWEITAAGAYKDIHDFGGTITGSAGGNVSDGSNPNGILIDNSGVLYGTVGTGGAHGAGLVWKLTAAGAYTDLHDFGGSAKKANGSYTTDGSAPASPLAFDSKGNLWGTTKSGAASGDGIVWTMNASGAYEIAHIFGGTIDSTGGNQISDGAHPISGVTFDSAGDVFGTASANGQNGAGLIWEITAAGVYKDVYDVSFDESYNGPTNIATDNQGNFWGTRSLLQNGVDNNLAKFGEALYDSLWEVTPSGSFKTVYGFGQQIENSSGGAYTDGYFPGPVAFDAYGDVFGTTQFGGPYARLAPPSGYGNLWEVTSAGSYVDLHDFGGTITVADGTSGSDGKNPEDAVSFDSSGNIYGTTSAGGKDGTGMIWKLTGGPFTKPQLYTVSLSTNSILGGNSLTGTVQLTQAAPSGGVKVTLSNDNPSLVTTPASVTIAAGASSATFAVSTQETATGDDVTITAVAGTVTKTVELTVTQPPIGLFTITTSSQSGDLTTLYGGQSATGNVSFDSPAPAGGWVVKVTSTSSSVTVPASFTIPEGQKNGTFTITTKGVSVATNLTVTVSCELVSYGHPLTLEPDPLSALSLSPSTVTGGASSTGTVTLSTAAPYGGLVVSLSSNSSSVTVPSSVTVLAGATSATFKIATSAVSKATSATITATSVLVSKTASITVNP